MKTIRLTQGKVTIVDDDVYEWASKFKWCAQRDTHTFYAVRHLPSVSGKKRLMTKLHREIMRLDASREVDHIDGDGLNNLRENLRPATRAENGRAFRRKMVNATSKFRGVCWRSKRKIWQASIKVNNKYHYLGVFENEENAARAYDKAASEKFGEVAQLNFPTNL